MSERADLSIDGLRRFLVEAKAVADQQWLPDGFNRLHNGSHEVEWAALGYRFKRTWSGFGRFAGQEIVKVTRTGHQVWTMTFGGVIHPMMCERLGVKPKSVLQFLTGVLATRTLECPYRGREGKLQGEIATNRGEGIGCTYHMLLDDLSQRPVVGERLDRPLCAFGREWIDFGPFSPQIYGLHFVAFLLDNEAADDLLAASAAAT